MFRVIKKWGHERGLSCAFRQWRADHSHCHYLHGYALAVEVTFGAETLDARNWVIDFGGLKGIEQRLKEMFDHKTIIAHDDPKLDVFHDLHDEGIIDLRITQDVGIEAFASEILHMIKDELKVSIPDGRGRHSNDYVHVERVRVFEHDANCAEYCP